MPPRLDPRAWLLAGLAALVVFPLAAGLAAWGVPAWLAVAAVAGLAVLIIVRAWPRLPEAFAAPVDHYARPLFAAWLILATVAGVQMARLSLFMHDASRADCSVLPDREFFRNHACLSAYTEASRLAPTGANIYDRAVYENRKIGRLDVDLFQYPPAFLLLGGAFNAVTPDFFKTRATWFAVQAAALLAAALALALWVGGTTGARMAWLVPVVWLAVPTRLVMQLGNFQVSAFSWSIGAMLLAPFGSAVLAGALLGFCSAGKIFPGALVIWTLGRGRWRPVIAAGVWAGIWLVVAIAWFGFKPQIDFFQYQIPRIQSGDAFFWVDDADVVLVNQSIYGLVTRLRALGVPGMTRQAGNLVSSVYGVAVMGLALWAGWRARTRPVDGEAHRAADAATWLGLLNLASFRSPFVPDAYAYVGSLWLGTVLVGARRRVTAALLGATVVGWWALSRVFDGVTRTSTPAWLALLVMAIQGLALALSVWAVLQPITSRQSR
jgi:hypothetical protein